MPNGDSFDTYNLLHLLLLPLGGAVGWLIRQLGLKADKDDMEKIDERFTATMEAFQEERREMHRENTARLQDIQKTLMDVIGGRYNNNDRR